MPLYELSCDACGYRTEILGVLSLTEQVACPCGAVMRRVMSRPQVIVKSDAVPVDPVERAKRESEMRVVVPRREFLRRVRAERAARRRNVSRETLES